MSKKYDIDFKDSVIMFYREAKKVPNAKAFRDTIKRFGLNHQTLSRWIHEYEPEPMNSEVPSVISDLRQSYIEKWDKCRKEIPIYPVKTPTEINFNEKYQQRVFQEENARDDYDHIETWPYELTETDLRFLIKQCLAHARHAGGRSYLRLSHVISVLEGRLQKGVG